MQGSMVEPMSVGSHPMEMQSDPHNTTLHVYTRAVNQPEAHRRALSTCRVRTTAVSQ
jgi:hypothetical protein